VVTDDEIRIQINRLSTKLSFCTDQAECDMMFAKVKVLETLRATLTPAKPA
jgi:hypothetical protein